MKLRIACAGVLAMMLAACSSGNPEAGLKAMHLEDGKSGSVTYASRTVSGGNVQLKDVILGGKDGDGLKAETLEFGGLDVTKDGKAVFQSLTLRNLTPQKSDPETTLKVDSLTLSKPNAVTAQYVAALFGPEPPKDAPPFDQWGWEKLSLNGFNLKANPNEDNGDGVKKAVGTINLSLKEISVSGVKNKIAAAALLSGLKGDIDMPSGGGAGNSFPIKGVLNWGDTKITNLRGAVFEAAIKAAQQSAEGKSDSADIQKLSNQVMATMGSPVDPGYDKLTSDPFTLNVSGVSFATSPISASVDRDSKGVATHVVTPRFTMTLSSNAAEGQLGQMVGGGLGMLGYQKVEIFAQSDAKFDPATDETRFTGYTLGLTDGFDLSFKGGFKGLSTVFAGLTKGATAAPGATAEPNVNAFKDFVLVDLDLTLADKSIFDRLLNLAATFGGGGTPEEMRAKAISSIAELKKDLAATGVDPVMGGEMLDAVSAFIKKPGTLHIVMKPPTPLKMGDITDSKKLDKKTLGFTATYTPPAK